VARSRHGPCRASPAPPLRWVDSDGQAYASTVVQGQPGIEPGRSLAVAAGLLACASKHNGLLHVSVASRSLRSLGVHTAAAEAFAPCGCTQPPLCLAPLRPCARHQLALMPCPIQKLVLAMATPSPQRTIARRCAQSWRLAPPDHPPPPRGSPASCHHRESSLHWPDSVAPCSPRQGFANAALRAPLTRLRAALGEVGQWRSP
jgi:hypothetical protein